MVHEIGAKEETVLEALSQRSDEDDTAEIDWSKVRSATKLRLLRARRELLQATIAVINEEISRLAHGESDDVDLAAFRPEWKDGERLTPAGRAAAFAAFDGGMRQVEVARLMQISTPSAHRIQKIWEQERGR